jgi:hypothetical protein
MWVEPPGSADEECTGVEQAHHEAVRCVTSESANAVDPVFYGRGLRKLCGLQVVGHIAPFGERLQSAEASKEGMASDGRRGESTLLRREGIGNFGAWRFQLDCEVFRFIGTLKGFGHRLGVVRVFTGGHDRREKF